MRRDEIVAANRAGWDEAAPRHRARNFAALEAAVRKPGFSCLDDIATLRLAEIGVAGRDVAQLCCNNGRELLSLKSMGAGRCVGFDLSPAFIDQARALARAGNIEAEFVEGDLHTLGPDRDGRFDLVLVTIGALCWFPEAGPFFAVARRLMRPGGVVFVYEQHPILDMFEPYDEGDPPPMRYSYFQTDPFIDSDGLDYYDGVKYASKPLYNFHHKMSDIVMACIDNGLAIEHFAEYDRHLWDGFPVLARAEARLPCAYTLIARSEPT